MGRGCLYEKKKAGFLLLFLQSLDTEVSVRVSATAAPGGKLVPFLNPFTATACNSSGLKVHGYPW